jgi:predicted amidophosphoribosyltransferase
MLARALALLAPPLCGACGSPSAATSAICSTCSRALAGAGGGITEVPGVGPVTWAAPYTGVPRDLVTALKFGHRLALAGPIAQAIAAAVDPAPLTAVVPVPPAPARRRHRGFDPAELIAGELAKQLGLPRGKPLRRENGPRQVGRPRSERLAVPPRVRAVAEAHGRPLLIDDVLTTGATLAACARALRDAGATGIHAAVFARALGDSGGAA